MASVQNRFRSPVAWAGVAGLFVLIANAYGLWSVIGIDAQEFIGITNALSSVLIAFGVFNNPTDSEGY